MKRLKYVLALILCLGLLGGLGYAAVNGLGADKSGSLSSINLGLDLAGGVSITYEVVGDENPSKEDMSDTIFKLQQRVQQYSTEALVYQEGSNRINIEIPGVSDVNKILEDLGQPGNLYFIAQTDASGADNYTYHSSRTSCCTHAVRGSHRCLQKDRGRIRKGETERDHRKIQACRDGSHSKDRCSQLHRRRTEA